MASKKNLRAGDKVTWLHRGLLGRRLFGAVMPNRAATAGGPLVAVRVTGHEAADDRELVGSSRWVDLGSLRAATA